MAQAEVEVCQGRVRPSAPEPPLEKRGDAARRGRVARARRSVGLPVRVGRRARGPPATGRKERDRYDRRRTFACRGRPGPVGAGGGAACPARAAARRAGGDRRQGRGRARRRAGRAARGRRDALLLGDAARLPAGVELLVKSPGVPNAVARRGRGAGSRRADLERGRVRLALPDQPAGSRSPAPTARRRPPSSPARSCATPAGRSRWPATSAGPSPACPVRSTPRAVVVAELSSFQLEHIERFRPDVAVLLNLTEDHIDRHGSFAGYVDAKLRIFENQTPADLALVNVDDPGTAAALAGRLAGARAAAAASRCRRRRRRAGAAPTAAQSRCWPGVSAGAPLAADTPAGRERAVRRRRARPEGRAQRRANSLAAAAAAAAVGVRAAATSPRRCARSPGSPIASRWSAWSPA